MENLGVALIITLVVMGAFLFVAFLGAVTASGMQGLSNKLKKSRTSADEDDSVIDDPREEGDSRRDGR